jgi:hypothetical protein
MTLEIERRIPVAGDIDVVVEEGEGEIVLGL